MDVSEELCSLVPMVAKEIVRKPTNLGALRDSLDALLTFLASPAGRTDPNCRTVDHFFHFSEDYGWDPDWDDLPDAFQDILSGIAGALHDTVGAPEVARDLESTPEQLLERLRRIEV